MTQKANIARNDTEEVGGEYKFLPKKYNAPGMIDIFGDYIHIEFISHK